MKHLFYAAIALMAVCAVGKAAETPGVIEIRQSNGGFCYATFSPDGTKIVTAAKDNTARIWCAQTGRELRTLPHADWVRHAVFSPDGTKIITGGSELTARIWYAESGRLLQRLEGHGETEGFHVVGGVQRRFANWVYPAIFSPDGKKVLTTGGDKTVRIWDVETGKELHKLEGHLDHVRIIVFTPDGKKAISASQDANVKIWDVDTGKELHNLEGSAYATHRPAPALLSPDGARIVLGSRNANTATIRCVESGEELLVLEGHESWLLTAAFSPDGKKIVTTSSDETARIWCAESGRELQRLQGDPNDRHRNVLFNMPPPPGIDSFAKVQFDYAAFSPDGRKVFTTGNPHDRVIRVWDVETGKELHTFGGHEQELTLAFALSPDGKKLVTHGWSLTVHIWDLENLPTPVLRPAIRNF